MTMIDGTPKPVRKFAENVTAEVGVTPEILRPGPALWQVRLAGQHITATADFRPAGGRTRWASGRLLVDGEPRQMLELRNLRTLWDELEGGLAKAVLDPVPPLPPDAEMPGEVTRLEGRLGDALAAQDEVVLATGYDAARDTWIVGIDLPGGDGARFRYVPEGGGRRKLVIQIVYGGIDRSAGIGGDIRKALAALTGHYPGAEDKPAAGHGQRGRGARDNGIETRRRVVIRE